MHLQGVNWFGILGCTAMVLFVIMAVWASPRIQRWAERPEPRSNAIDSSNYTTPEHPLHMIDLVRSEIYVQPAGSVIAKCAVQGCPITVVLGRNVAQAIIVEDGR